MVQLSFHRIVFSTLMKAASLFVTHQVALLPRKEKDPSVQLPVWKRGRQLLSCVASVLLHGTYVPPMIIFPRVRMKPSFMDRAPAGSLGVAAKTGWINEQLFTSWFDHFLKFTQSSANCSTPTLRILDGHCSHVKNTSVIMKARESNVIILSLPSHCTHKMQPLDISFFKSLSTRYNAVVQTWHRQHPGRPVTEADFGELFSLAYGDASQEFIRTIAISSAMKTF